MIIFYGNFNQGELIFTDNKDGYNLYEQIKNEYLQIQNRISIGIKKELADLTDERFLSERELRMAAKEWTWDCDSGTTNIESPAYSVFTEKINEFFDGDDNFEKHLVQNYKIVIITK